MFMRQLIAVILLLSATGPAQAGQSTVVANPIRKVVSLMQNMQKEIEAEGEKEKELFEKFMCFCNGNSADLAKGAADAKAKIEEYSSRLKSSEAEKSQAEQDIVGHKSDLAAAEKDLAEATAVRAKEEGEAAASVADSETNIKAVAAAIPALEKGMGGAALMQTADSDRLNKIFDSFPFHDENDRSNLLAFFQDGGDYAPQSGQIVGIMRQMKDEMEATLATTNEDEAKAVETFASMKTSKEGEIETAKEAIETKTKRSGELAVIIVESQDGLDDQQTELADTEKFRPSARPSRSSTTTTPWTHSRRLSRRPSSCSGACRCCSAPRAALRPSGGPPQSWRKFRKSRLCIRPSPAFCCSH